MCPRPIFIIAATYANQPIFGTVFLNRGSAAHKMVPRGVGFVNTLVLHDRVRTLISDYKQTLYYIN